MTGKRPPARREDRIIIRFVRGFHVPDGGDAAAFLPKEYRKTWRVIESDFSGIRLRASMHSVNRNGLDTLIACAAIFGLRGLYFALFEEARVPAAVTGAAVGLVSVVGYTPDIFVNYIGGMLLDSTPGLAGHQHFFMFLAAFSALGVATAVALAIFLHSSQARRPAP